MDIGSVISRQRQEKGLSQKQLAELIGVSTGTVAEWESGESFPSLEQLQYICTILKIEINKISNQSDSSEQVSYAQNKIVQDEHKKKKTKNHKGMFLLLLCVLCVVVGIATVFFFSRGKVFSRPFSDDPEAIETAVKSVVKLNCYDKNNELVSSGSGVCLYDSIIVTNYHVVEKISKVEIITDDDKHYFTDQVIAYDKDRDIVLLQEPSNLNLVPLKTGDESILKKGERVVTISSPIGITNSVSSGVFSGTVIEDYMKILQFTAPISHGSSGGALFNDKGEVIGITYGGYESGQNLNLAIPVSEIERIYKRKRYKPIGISEIYELTPYEAFIDKIHNYDIYEMDYYSFFSNRSNLDPNTIYIIEMYCSKVFIDTQYDFIKECIVSFSAIDMIGKEQTEPDFWRDKSYFRDLFFEFKIEYDKRTQFHTGDKCIVICMPIKDYFLILGIQNITTNEFIDYSTFYSFIFS